ncbi:ribonuclease P protein component [Candidatus Saccharibacteria bacterium]|nr:ribonuclease P protein component [Candidatus Saccharibacteria bacterium]
MLSQPYRFHGHSSLSYVFRKGHTVRGHHLMIRTVRNDRRQLPRIAVIISKKVAKRAHDRNRIRRRLYEALRLELPHITGAYDIAVMVTSREIESEPFMRIEKEVQRLLKVARVVAPPPQE